MSHLEAHRYNGRHSYPVQAMWRAYLASFFLNLAHTNDLIRRLHGDQDLRVACGFIGKLPHRRTFNRFIRTLSRHPDLVEACSVGVMDMIRKLLPGLGQEVAVDSTVVRTHCNPWRKRISDPEASWTGKQSGKAKSNGTEWYWGYKVHLVADANYGLPLAQVTTTAKRNDSPELPVVVEKARAMFPWFRPSVVIADKGYDSLRNHELLQNKDILPVIHVRKNARDSRDDGIYTEQGGPTCLGGPMEYVRSDPERGRLYRCRSGGCHLAGSMRGGTSHCDDAVWEDPKRNIRFFGTIRREGQEWKDLYAKRQAIEQTFKSLKQSRRLDRHCVRGLRQITLHSLMSVLAYQATALVRIMAGEAGWMRWMVRKIV